MNFCFFFIRLSSLTNTVSLYIILPVLRWLLDLENLIHLRVKTQKIMLQWNLDEMNKPVITRNSISRCLFHIEIKLQETLCSFIEVDESLHFVAASERWWIEIVNSKLSISWSFPGCLGLLIEAKNFLNCLALLTERERTKNSRFLID